MSCKEVISIPVGPVSSRIIFQVDFWASSSVGLWVGLSVSTFYFELRFLRDIRNIKDPRVGTGKRGDISLPRNEAKQPRKPLQYQKSP